jgi:methionyl-tRNA formyltransferase
MGDILLLGSTDVTLAIGEAVLASGSKLAAVVSVGDSFSISYSSMPVANVRVADIAGWCSGRGIPFIQFQTYEKMLEEIKGASISLCLVAGWYHMVPRTVRDRFPLGAIGFHASLLPQLRGGAPLNWAILTGLRETGITMFQLTDGMDDGAIFGQRRLRVGNRTAIGDLVSDSVEASKILVRELLPGVLDGSIRPAPQVGTASYALQRRPEDGRIDWKCSATEIDRLIRATGRPYPGAFTYFEGQKVVIWRAGIPSEAPVIAGAAGQLCRLPEVEGLLVVTGGGALEVKDATNENGESVVGHLRKNTQRRFDP